MIYSYTMMATASKCMRLFKLKYVDRLELRKIPIYFVTGRAFHEAREAWLKGQNWQEVIDRIFGSIDTTTLRAHDIAKIEEERAKASGMMYGYANRYPEYRRQHNIMEQEFLIKLKGRGIRGFIDWIIKDGDDIVMIETKTASNPDVDYFKRVKIDWQVHLYMVAIRSIFGRWPSRIIYEVIVKPGIRLRKNETPAQYQERLYQYYTDPLTSSDKFIREEIILSKENLTEMKDELLYTIERIEQATRDQRYPKCPEACNGKYGPCDFMPICTNGGRVDKLLFTKRKERR